jgi:hypothetical protein
MTLNWHDWFATSRAILSEITRDPAMLLCRSGSENTKWPPD